EFFRHKLEDQLEIYRRQNLELAESNRIISEKTNALETNNNLLIATNVLLNRVISILAHDLRGPVSSIYQTLDLFKEGVFSDSEKEELIEQLNQSSKTTYRLINELLSLAQKYKTGGEDDPALIDVNHEIQDCISLTYTVARPKQIKLIYHPNPNLPQIKLIRSRFRLILRNLLANAVKFSHPGSEVLASIQDLGDIFQLQIMDQGIGMNPTQIDHILAGSSFTQTGTQEEKGFGLGLVFVLESILQTNGKLDIASSPGKGSCFTISWDKSLLM
ncbi:MAG: HAMP domain-containing sensor histidine kinase, partial [Candidatus Cloacimonetes bacterium]|nr:HAMP domain-containing sensor histidine kinase [Candidatus Cloacimonadota bacterium]